MIYEQINDLAETHFEDTGATHIDVEISVSGFLTFLQEIQGKIGKEETLSAWFKVKFLSEMGTTVDLVGSPFVAGIKIKELSDAVQEG